MVTGVQTCALPIYFPPRTKGRGGYPSCSYKHCTTPRSIRLTPNGSRTSEYIRRRVTQKFFLTHMASASVQRVNNTVAWPVVRLAFGRKSAELLRSSSSLRTTPRP